MSSTFLGNDALGRPQFDTLRSPIGELMYRLKYKHDDAVADSVVEAAIDFLSTWIPSIEVIVPVPPSNAVRRRQPVLEVARHISRKTGLPLCEQCIRKVKATGPMKDIDSVKRGEVLSDAYTADPDAIAHRSVLLFDDLYDSGATAHAVTKTLLDQGGAAAVYLLTLTQAR